MEHESRCEVSKWRRLKRERPERVDTPGPGQESVWDYPRPPRVERVGQRVRVELAGIVLADSVEACRALETANPPAYYIPPPHVRREWLEPSRHSTLCEWKGAAQYWSIRVGDRFVENGAWSYPDPFDGYEGMGNFLAFFAGKMNACYVGEQCVIPQPGGYYGGWVTSHIVGPFKGGPGTELW